MWDEGKEGVRSNVGNDLDIRLKRKINFREKVILVHQHVRIICKGHQGLMFFPLLSLADRWCSVVLTGAQWCSLVLSGAQWCSLVPSGAQLCSVVPSGAQWCSVVPSGAQWCSVVPSGAQCSVIPAAQ